VLNVTVEELDDLLTGYMPSQSPPAARLDCALTHPATADLISVAYLRERVTKPGAAHDTAPSTALLAQAGQCLGQIGFQRRDAATSLVGRELTNAESAAATLMGKLTWDASSRRDRATPLGYLDRATAAARHLGSQDGERPPFYRLDPSG